MSLAIANAVRWKDETALAKSLLDHPRFDVAADGWCLISGDIRIARRVLGELGPFHLEIQYPPDFPEHDPNVYLISHPHWRHLDNHIEPDGRFCWTEVKDSPIDFYRQDALKLLVANIAYRLMQVEMKMRKGLAALPGPERAHFEEGERQAKTSRKRRGIGPNTRPCICGRDVKFKNCHARREVLFRGKS